MSVLRCSCLFVLLCCVCSQDDNFSHVYRVVNPVGDGEDAGADNAGSVGVGASEGGFIRDGLESNDEHVGR